MIRGSEKYDKEDMPVPATFASEPKGLMLFLEPVQYVKGPDDSPVRKPGTGMRVQFRDHQLTVKNKAVLAKMLKSSQFGAVKGFSIDRDDPTGFWQAAGVLEEKVVKKLVLTDGTKLPTTIDPSEVAESHKRIQAQRRAEEDQVNDIEEAGD